MYVLCATNRSRACFRKSYMTDLPLLYQLFHRADCFLDRNIGIHPVLVIKINHAYAQALQAFVARFEYVFRAPRDVNPRSLRITNVAEFGSQEDLVAAALDRTPDQFFVMPHSVNIRCIEEVD